MRSSLLLIGIFVLTGCGDSGLAPVSGTVTLDGKPLPNATVVFQPDSTAKETGPGSSGTTDAQGHYTLRTTNANVAGAVLGKHKVSITSYEGDGEDSSAPNVKSSVIRKALIPEEYNVKTTLTFNVVAGSNGNANFDLKSTPARTK